MQGFTDPPRASLTAADIVALIETPNLTVDPGLELVEPDGTSIDDISDRLKGGSVSHNNFATIHGTCLLDIEGALEWGSARVMPYITLSDGTTEARFNLGVYLLDTPARVIGETPETYNGVEGYDQLAVLNVLAAQSVSYEAGSVVTDVVTSILDDHGAGAAYIVEPSAAVLSQDFTRPLDDRTTWLGIVNELLGMIGYRAVWCDWNGKFRVHPYQSPSERTPEWTYDADSESTTLGEHREVEEDYFDAPNRWVGVRNDPASGLASTIDGGLLTIDNESDGRTSQEARGWRDSDGVLHPRIIPRVLFLDVVDDDALATRLQSIVDESKFIDASFRWAVGPNPLHWHADVVSYADAAYGSAVTAAVHEWTLPFDGSDMPVTARRAA